MAERIVQRYGAFVKEASPPSAEADPPAFRLCVEIDAHRRPPGLHREWVANPRYRAEGDLDAVVIDGAEFSGELSWTAGSGRIVVPDSLAHVDLFVRVVLGVALLRRGDATLIHAAGIVRHRWGLAFSGPSGAGKSTIAAICRREGLTVLADEMLVVRRDGAGTRLDGTPLWHGCRTSAPAAAIFVLEQADGPAVERLSPADALAPLMRAGGAPLELPTIQQAFFEALAAVLRRVPAYRLRFAPDGGFFAAIDRLSEFSFWRARPATPASAVFPLRRSGSSAAPKLAPSDCGDH
ncbi:MAG: hypothetical protein JSV80_02840 [Acidobacteriota bacterium]|nr:MAG: hypothetical protein JSV80_02840 [Acidobacteriota bacterium]